jgi:phosphomannomutase/phosphoglucomutase
VIEPAGAEEAAGLNYVGVRRLGHSLGDFLQSSLEAGNRIVVGHDYRSYSENVKNALVVGLLSSGMDVTDIGLTISPGAYFAQFALDIPCVAMVTASHNENGWTGIKMGHRLASTFGPSEMADFREFALNGEQVAGERPGGRAAYTFDPSMIDRYIAHIVESWAPRFEGLPKPKVAVETGNGTAGIFLPEILTRLGFELVLGNVELDWTFPHFNPNPESVPFLRAVEKLVKSSGSDIGVCIDGDGDRLGVIDDRGRLVFADRVGLLIARHLEAQFGSGRPMVIDVKSTSLFETELESPVVWAKTGHSYVKAKVAEVQARAGFERSGHFFLTEPLGHGYDDACVAALAMLWVVSSARAQDSATKLSGLLDDLPQSFASPNRQPFVPDELKYSVADKIAAALEKRSHFAGQEVARVDRLNGVRITFPDRSWLLVRASSNSPNLVIVAEAFDRDGSFLRLIDSDLRSLISELGVEVGQFEPLHEL